MAGRNSPPLGQWPILLQPRCQQLRRDAGHSRLQPANHRQQHDDQPRELQRRAGRPPGQAHARTGTGRGRPTYPGDPVSGHACPHGKRQRRPVPIDQSGQAARRRDAPSGRAQGSGRGPGESRGRGAVRSGARAKRAGRGEAGRQALPRGEDTRRPAAARPGAERSANAKGRASGRGRETGRRGQAPLTGQPPKSEPLNTPKVELPAGAAKPLGVEKQPAGLPTPGAEKQLKTPAVEKTLKAEPLNAPKALEKSVPLNVPKAHDLKMQEPQKPEKIPAGAMSGGPPKPVVQRTMRPEPAAIGAPKGAPAGEHRPPQPGGKGEPVCGRPGMPPCPR